MPLLRDAVERKRKHVIKLLIQAGVFHQTDPELQTYTLSELEAFFKKYKKEAKC